MRAMRCGGAPERASSAVTADLRSGGAALFRIRMRFSAWIFISTWRNDVGKAD
jgi:hypothetical protein